MYAVFLNAGITCLKLYFLWLVYLTNLMQIPIGLETLLVAEEATLSARKHMSNHVSCMFALLNLLVPHTKYFATVEEVCLAGIRAVFSAITWMPSLIQVGHCNLAGCSQPGVSQLRPSIAVQPPAL